MANKIKTHRDLEVYKLGFDSAMSIFNASKMFPKEEIYSLTDQIRRSSRAVCSNIAEAWRADGDMRAHLKIVSILRRLKLPKPKSGWNLL